MYKTNDYREVFEKLNIDIMSAKSIYKYAPVFKVYIENQPYVLKKTKADKEKGEKLIEFQSHLNQHDAHVVEPVLVSRHLHTTVNDDNWVVYPFVEGDHYSGTKNQIREAGALLGKIHASTKKIFNHGFSWDNYGGDFFSDIQEDFKVIQDKYEDVTNLSKLITNTLLTKFDDLRTQKVPYVDGIWDYKASNLIYGKEVTLIDSDNSGYIPRILDLTLVLLLFNTEVDSAPNRPFTVEEWETFLSGYNTFVELEDEEKSLFHRYLEFTFIDEVLWAIVDLDDDESQRQVDFMRNLLSINHNIYSL